MKKQKKKGKAVCRTIHVRKLVVTESAQKRINRLKEIVNYLSERCASLEVMWRDAQKSVSLLQHQANRAAVIENAEASKLTKRDAADLRSAVNYWHYKIACFKVTFRCVRPWTVWINRGIIRIGTKPSKGWVCVDGRKVGHVAVIRTREELDTIRDDIKNLRGPIFGWERWGLRKSRRSG